MIRKIIGKEISFWDLDEIMIKEGYYSVLKDGVIKEIKQDKNVNYKKADESDDSVLINFEIVINNEPSECEECFILKVLDVIY